MHLLVSLNRNAHDATVGNMADAEEVWLGEKKFGWGERSVAGV